MEVRMLAKPIIVMLVAVLTWVGAQAPIGLPSDVVVVTRSGDALQLRNASVGYRPDGPVPRAGGPEFSLHHALAGGVVRSIVLDHASAEGLVWRVVRRDGPPVVVRGGEVWFEGEVVGANALGLVGYLSVHIGTDAASSRRFSSVTFLDGLD